MADHHNDAMMREGAAVEEARAMEEDLLDGAYKLGLQCRALSERVSAHFQRSKNEKELLTGEVGSVQQELKDLTARLAEVEGQLPSASVNKVSQSLERTKLIFEGSGPGDDLRKLQPAAKNPFMLRLLLGKNISVITQRRADGLKIKEEYHRFRDTNAVYFSLFAMMLLAANHLLDYSKMYEPSDKLTFIPPIKVGIQLFLCWLLYFYVVLALRENVLRANGSKLHPWWIQHHYYSIGLVLTMLTLPVDSPSVDRFSEIFLQWCVAQGFVMVLQNRYQRRRMYTRIALGKNSKMDVVAGESCGTSGQLLMLLPLFFALQLGQGYIGSTLVMMTWRTVFTSEGWLEMEDHASDLRGSRGACFCGLLFLRMAVGNFVTLIQTLVRKRLYRKEAQSRSSQKGPALSAFLYGSTSRLVGLSSPRRTKETSKDSKDH